MAKLVGKNSNNYNLGFGAFLKFAYPLSESTDFSLEVGALYFGEKQNSANAVAYVPVKVGYRYLTNESGAGFYVEPQVGYNVYGIRSTTGNDGYNVDEKFHGIIVSLGAGYPFPPVVGIQFDLGIRYESVFYNGNSVNCIGLRLSHNFSFKRRDID